MGNRSIVPFNFPIENHAFMLIKLYKCLKSRFMLGALKYIYTICMYIYQVYLLFYLRISDTMYIYQVNTQPENLSSIGENFKNSFYISNN